MEQVSPLEWLRWKGFIGVEVFTNNWKVEGGVRSVGPVFGEASRPGSDELHPVPSFEPSGIVGIESIGVELGLFHVVREDQIRMGTPSTP